MTLLLLECSEHVTGTLAGKATNWISHVPITHLALGTYEDLTSSYTRNYYMSRHSRIIL